MICRDFRSLALVVGVLSAMLASSCELDPPGVTYGELQHDGQVRTYRLYVPPVQTKAPVPLLVGLHGGGGNGTQFGRGVGFDALALSEGFIAVYPDAIEGNWNDGREDPAIESQRLGIDDVGFIRALVAHLASTQSIDASRIYVTGPSNGGMMTLRLACEASDVFAAAAPVIGNMPSALTPNCLPANSMPIQFINGMDDPLVPWEGGNVVVNGRPRGMVDSVEDSVALWAQFNACDAPQPEEWLPDVDPSDGTRVWKRSYLNGTDGAEVILYGIQGGGHDWPGSKGSSLREGITGNTSQDIEATPLIWEFLSRFQR
ncbi:MAG: hydrolase [Candidatus Hydrogenedentota bacterium]